VAPATRATRPVSGWCELLFFAMFAPFTTTWNLWMVARFAP
jgi:hypothetical protein